MLKQYLIMIGVILLPCCCFAQDIYIAQSSAGSNNGADCANAYAISWFNTSSNWANPKRIGKIGPGDTVHLCGTFTAFAGASGYLTFAAGGTSDSPITLLFQSGAILTAPFWGTNGAIYSNGNSYVIVDGGTNGAITATANGTYLANQQDGSGVLIINGNNCTVKNLTVSNMYVHSSTSDAHGQLVYGIQVGSGNNDSIYGNTIHDTKFAILFSYPGGGSNSNVNIYNNTIYNIDHGIVVGDGDVNATMTTANIYNNVIHDFSNWDDTELNNHHDGIHVWSMHSGSLITGLNIYNNYIYGSCGTGFNASIYIQGGMANVNIFNNLLVATSPPTSGYGYLGLAGFGYHITTAGCYNNTIIGTGTNVTSVISIEDVQGITIKNNIGSTAAGMLYIPSGYGTTIKEINNNLWYNWGSSGFNVNGVIYNTFSGARSYQSSTLYDANGISANPNLSANFNLYAPSPAIGAGANLTSLGITPLDFDRIGNLRAATGAWDIGAYLFKRPFPPTVY